MTKYKIILNPAAGKGSAAKQAYQIEQQLQQHGLDYDIDLTQKPWHAAEMAFQAVTDNFDVVVAAGGDGTVNEVINGLMEAKNKLGKTAAMAILPVGRGNDFSFSMGYPATLTESIEVLVEDFRKKIDIGFVSGGLYPTGRYFGNGVGIGFDATVGFVAAEQSLSGFASYLLAAVKTLMFYYKAPLVDMSLDDQVISKAFAMISIMNGRRMGGGFMMAPTGDPSDGLLNICAVADIPQMKLVPLIPKFMSGAQNGHPAVTTYQTRTIKIKAIKGTLPVHADGETICTEGDALSIELFHHQIELITQKQEAA